MCWDARPGQNERWLDYSSESDPGEGGRAPDADGGQAQAATSAFTTGYREYIVYKMDVLLS